MIIFDEWMCSAPHLKLFGFVTRIGLVLWLPLPSLVAYGPWFYWANRQGYSTQLFAVGTLLLALPVVVIGLTGFRRLCRPGSRVVLQVELRPGLLGLHVGKQIPSRTQLLANILDSVTIAQRLRLKAIRVESPLLVKGPRLGRLIAALQQAFPAQGHSNVTVVVVQPKRMFWLRSLVFNAMRKLRKYDEKGTHLPPHSWWKCQTAGVRLVLR